MQLVAQRQCKAFCSAYTEAGGEQTLNIAAYSGVDDQSMWMPPQVTRICMSAFAHWLISGHENIKIYVLFMSYSPLSVDISRRLPTV